MNNISKRAHNSVLRLITIIVILALSMTGCGNSEEKGGGDYPKEHTAPDITLNIEEFEDIIDNIADNTVDNADNIDNTVDNAENNSAVLFHPDDYYIKWAVPDDSIKIQDEWVLKINDRLMSEGYPFRLQLIRIYEDKDKDYKTLIDECDADIVFTGYENYKSRFALRGMIEGRYEDLTPYIEKSELKNIIPEKLLKSVFYKGHIYLLPSEWGADGENEVLLYSGENEIVRSENFKEDIFLLREYINLNNKLYYGVDRFGFMRFFGYYYDAVNGIIINSDGEIVNPFRNEECLKWMRLVNEWYKTGYAPDPAKLDRDVLKSQCTFHLSEETDMQKEEILESWKIELSNRYICSTAIRKDSPNKEYAFKLLELFRTDHNYGNLIIFGTNEIDEIIPKQTTFLNNVTFGLDDGLLRIDDAFRHFSSSEERIDFYENEVILSPVVDMDIPFECYELCGIIDKYLIDENILFSDDFENKLENFQNEYTDAFDRIIMNSKR